MRLGKSGSVTALLKTLGAMDAETRAAEGAEDPRAARERHGGDRGSARPRSRMPISTGG